MNESCRDDRDPNTKTIAVVGAGISGLAASRTYRAAATKSLYVSPFMPVDLEYTFAFTLPAGHLVAHMETSQAGSVGFDATLSLERRPWNAAEIRRVHTGIRASWRRPWRSTTSGSFCGR
jgi:Protein of unknown function (DUF1365)